MKKHCISIVFLSFLAVLAVLFAVLPKDNYSENEKRVLSDLPNITLASIADSSWGKDFETYLADHFPLRTFFVGVDAYARQMLGQNGHSGIYEGWDGYLLPVPAEIDEDQAVRNITIFADFVKNSGLPASIMAVPTAGHIMEKNLPLNHEPYSDGLIQDLIKEHAGEMEVIPLTSAFKEEKNQVYYRTDHHLTSGASYRMYQEFCNKFGKYPTPHSCKERYTGFYGTGYSKSGLWLKNSDVLEIWKPETEVDCTVTIHDTDSYGVYDSLYFPEHLNHLDKYPVFLDGNHGLVTIENHNRANGKRLLLIKDSYAHCFATFAISDYEQICMVDLRYYRNNVSDLIDKYGLTEILYLYGIENLATSTDIPWLQ